MFDALFRWELYRLARLRNIVPLLLAALLIGLSPSYAGTVPGIGFNGSLGLLMGFFLAVQWGSARESEAHFFFSRPVAVAWLFGVRFLGTLAGLLTLMALVVPAVYLGIVVTYSTSTLVWIHLLVPEIFSPEPNFNPIAWALFAGGLLGISLGLLSLFRPFWRGLRSPWPWLPTLLFVGAVAVTRRIPALDGWQNSLLKIPSFLALAALNLVIGAWLAGVRPQASQGMP
jgi:hypothetical protein